MDWAKTLKDLLDGTASEDEILLLRQALVNGEISIGGDVSRSVVIIGSGNKVELTSEALNLLKPEAKTEEQVEGEPPYMGLRYFDTQDEDLFYGREALTRELLARTQKESFLAIVGASGSGKSSVARAGLIPAWMKENERGVIHVITPTTHPLESLAASLTRESESVTAISTLMNDLKNDSRSLRLYIKKLLGETKLLLLVDQFEETFTLCKDADERKEFIENLLTLADDEGAARVVITLRADFYHHCAEYEGLRQALKKHQEYIGAMTADELRQAITKPAENNGWDFQPGLVDLILQDVGTEPGALPLLSHALLETWKRRQGRTLALKGYADAGGVKKAIAQTAESVYDKLTPAEQTIARGIFFRLTELGEGVQDTRRRVQLSELGTQDTVGKVLKTLTDARLVTTEKDNAEVAHEALIREWGALRKWLDKDRESLRLHRHLTETAQEWEHRKHDPGELYRGGRLQQVQEWVKEHEELLNPLERDFFKACVAEIRRERTSIRLRRIAFGGAYTIALVTIILAITGDLNRFIYRPVDMEDYWVTIPAGEFQMGSSDEQIAEALKVCSNCDFSNEQPQHWVRLSEYKIGKYEVTNKQYNQCIRARVCIRNLVTEMLDHPVVSVNWYEAQTYCEWVGGRLPTEAEWEKAASWDDEKKIKLVYPWGNAIDCSYANFWGKDGGCVGTTTPVGTYPDGVSTYGVFDMAGNVWEWVSDSYRSDYYSTLGDKVFNPQGPIGVMGLRGLRGGSWHWEDGDMRSANRSFDDPTLTYFKVGFRCARDVP